LQSPCVHVVIRPFFGSHLMPKKDKIRTVKRGSRLMSNAKAKLPAPLVRH
jgi:hypothetical protein